MNTTIQNVEFYGKPIPTTIKDGIQYVGMKAVCENIGLAWNGQWERIQRHAVLKITIRVIRTVAEDNKERDLICLPLSYLNGWLFGVDISRIKREEVRERLLQYQRECFQVLYEYWHNGKAENPRTNPDERAGLRSAVTVLTTKRGLMHGEAYRLVHQRFNVEHIEEIPREKLGEAVEYVHRLALGGEYIPCKDRTETEDIRHHQVCAIAMMHAGRMRYEEQKRAMTLVRNRTAEAHERLKAINRVLAAAIDETGETLDLANSILHGSGAIWDGLHEALFHLYLPDDVMKDGKRRAQEHYKPRILA